MDYRAKYEDVCVKAATGGLTESVLEPMRQLGAQLVKERGSRPPVVFVPPVAPPSSAEVPAPSSKGKKG